MISSSKIFSSPSCAECPKNFVQPILLTETRDDNGRLICLWKTSQRGVLGIVVFPKGNFVIIPNEYIFNPLGNAINNDIAANISSLGTKQWHLVYEDLLKKITIWPYLIGAGRNYLKPQAGYSHPPLKIKDEPNKLAHMFRPKDVLKGHLPFDTPEARAFIESAAEPRNFVRRDRHGHDYHFKNCSDGTQGWARATLVYEFLIIQRM